MVAACIRLQNGCFPQQVWHEQLHQFIPRAFSGETIRFVTVSVSVNKSCSVSLVRIVLHPSFSLSVNIFTTLPVFQDKPHILFLGIALMHWALTLSRILGSSDGSSAYCDVTFFQANMAEEEPAGNSKNSEGNTTMLFLGHFKRTFLRFELKVGVTAEYPAIIVWI